MNGLYTFKYSSLVKRPTWKYVKESDGGDKFSDKSDKANRVEITDTLMQIFKNKYGSLSNGKYKLEVSTILINNDAFNGQGIRLMEKN